MDDIPESIIDITPAMEPPDGQTANFIDPFDLRTTAIVTTTIGLALTTILICLRLYTKRFLLKQPFHWEDYTCVMSLILYATVVGGIMDVVNNGGGRHQWNIHLNQAIALGYDAYWTEISFAASIAVAKTSILLQLRRVFAVSKKGLINRSCIFLLWFNALFYLAGDLAVIFGCTPISAYWDVIEQGTCVNKWAIVVVSCAVNVLTDVFIVLIPLWCLWHLTLPRKKKFTIGAVFATAAFSLGMAILKLVLSVPLLTTWDLTFTFNNVGLVAAAEVGSVLVCGCLPYVPRFVAAVFGHNDASSTPSGPPSHGVVGHDSKTPFARAPLTTYASSDGLKSSNRNEFDMEAKIGLSSEEERDIYTDITYPAAAQRRSTRPSLDSSTEVASFARQERGISPFTPISRPMPQARPPSQAVTSPRKPVNSSNPKSAVRSPTSQASAALRPGLEPVVPRSGSSTPFAELADTSPSSSTPTRARPRRMSNLSDRATTPTGQRALRALAGRFWRDAEDTNSWMTQPRRNTRDSTG